MRLALWKKAIREARWLLIAGATVLFIFTWTRIWLIGQLPLKDFLRIMQLLPKPFEKLAPLPLVELASTLGRVAAGYNEPLVVLVITVWGIARGSDAIAGEIGRGTMEMLLAQPVRRLTVLFVQGSVTLGGAALLALAAWMGTMVGVARVKLEDPITPIELLPAVLNLFSLAAFLAGVSTLVSSVDRYRSRVIGVMGGLYVFATVTKLVSDLSPKWHWVGYASFFSAFEPATVVVRADRRWSFVVEKSNGDWALGGLGDAGVLLGIAALSYVLAAVIFCRRDLPAPL
jgi:ABC-2 type transport system permease protein